jgi:hypothetical protein
VTEHDLTNAHRQIGRLSAALARLLSIPTGTCEIDDLLRASELTAPTRILCRDIRELRAVRDAAGGLFDAADELSSALAARGDIQLGRRLGNAADDLDAAIATMRAAWEAHHGLPEPCLPEGGE